MFWLSAWRDGVRDGVHVVKVWAESVPVTVGGVERVRFPRFSVVIKARLRATTISTAYLLLFKFHELLDARRSLNDV